MTPVLAAVHPETLIWIVLLLIGAISSIVSKARQARGAVQTMQSRRATPPPRPIVTQTFEAQAPTVVPQAPAPAAVVPPVIVRRPPPVSAPAPAMSVPASAQAHGTSGFRGMFERGSLVRAVVAAEVLGPPKALQEQSIWSPRHSEPSI